MTMTAVAPAPPRADAAPLRVGVARTPLAPHAPLALCAALRRLLGDDQVFLFESLAGPEEDCRFAAVGAGVLARVTVRDGRVGVDGRPELADRLRACADRADGDVPRLLRELHAAFDVRTDVPLDSYAFGFLGVFGYEAAQYLEQLPPHAPGQDPEIVLTLFRHVVRYDLDTGESHQLSADGAGFGGPDALGAGLAELVRSLPAEEAAVPPAPRPSAVRDTVRREEYADRVRRCLEHIRAGDVYQIQMGHRIDVTTPLPPLDAYRRLRRGNPSPYMYLVPWAGRTLIGASPELLFRIEGRGLAMRPIAGTTARAADPAEDARRVAALRADAKERAEHIMLVDLCRNDVARVCEPGTLAVERMMAVEGFSKVHHLVSTVRGELDGDADVWSVLRATFPAGTMTGAPKVRAMELIAEIEDRPRGAYAGAVGLIDLRGRAATLALCIRTAVHDPRTGTYALQASAGVVADSSADGEWRETMAKMGAVYTAVTGEELAA
ncbi:MULTISPECIES: anthranilate synthase component I family protein [Streptomyces]|uniref:Anthranilate synthase component I family protein n=1 Tax=Streptomyces chilikensis TaxID=1194079 RepID=A0ABV3EKE7_9ACTN|nr:anthranilate synthase component I family protein [Streptomyces sp. MJP52]MDH6225222.1 anthranilate synthase component 1 [Streptomyces sp. MJP52]